MIIAAASGFSDARISKTFERVRAMTKSARRIRAWLRLLQMQQDRRDHGRENSSDDARGGNDRRSFGRGNSSASGSSAWWDGIVFGDDKNREC